MRLGRGSASARRMARKDRVGVVAVLDALGVPLVGVEPLEHVLAPGHARRSVELDVVVVPEVDQLAETQVSGQGRGLGRDALLEVAVGHDRVDAMVDQLVARPVELRRRVAAPRWPSRRRSRIPGRAARWSLRRPASGRTRDGPGVREPHWRNDCEIVQGDVVAGQMEQRVEQHAGVPGRQDEAVAIRPVGLARGVAEDRVKST